MRYRTLPFVAELDAMEPEVADRVRQAAIQELVQNRGFQLLLGHIQATEAEALRFVKGGLAPDRNLGVLAGLESIRTFLRASLPVPSEVVEAHDEVEEDVLPPYVSPFLPTD